VAKPRIAYIFIFYPTLTQTFLQREVEALANQGLQIQIHSLFTVGPRGASRPPGDAPVDYFRWWEAIKLPAALIREFRRDPALVRDLWPVLRQYRWDGAENFWFNVWATIFALCRAPRFRRNKPSHIHGTWATGPATAAAILGRLCDIPFSFGAQAYDIYQHGGDGFLRQKLEAASFVHTTTEANVVYLRNRAGDSRARIVLARRGLERIPPLPAKPPPHEPLRILSVGRLIPKKGHEHQLAALVALRAQAFLFESRIIGDGPLRPKLQAQINSLGLGDRVTLAGYQSPERVEEAYQWADIFWHTGVIDPNRDRDGLPNVVPEALAHGLPVICGNVPGVIEAVQHEATGLVVNVKDADALASAVQRLAADDALRHRLGKNGRRWVEENFLISHNASILARAFHEACR
jgi:colanic acid/amylovoran biosynthesis glycosyltransferase